MAQYPNLFSVKRIGSLEIKNRTVMSAMGVDLADFDGSVNEKVIAYYTERAVGEVGLLITEYCRVDENAGACATEQLSLSHDKYIAPMSGLADSVHKHGAKIFVQLHHPGRQSAPIFPTFWSMNERIAKLYPKYWELFFKMSASIGSLDTSDPENVKRLKKIQFAMKPVLAPSLIPQNEDGVLLAIKYRAFKTHEIKKLVQRFIDAAERAKKAGIDGVELHASHGYLLQQFLSPHTNRRTDEYGGSFENRCRIMKELITGIHERCGADFPVTVRLTVNEFYEYLGHPERGIRTDEGVRLAQEMEKYGADAINVSIGSYDTSNFVTESVRHEPGWRKDMVKAVKDAVSIPVMGVGVIRTPELAEKLISEGYQDFIALGRPLLADPMWVRKAKDGNAEQINRCINCLACMDSFMANMLNDKPIECAINPRVCHETEYPLIPPKDGNGRKIVVVGAGPAGLAAARELALRQFDVTVLEKKAYAGGQINLADKPPHKERFSWCIDDLKNQVLSAGGKIQYGVTADADVIAGYAPYAVFIATGAYASKPPIPGADEPYVYTVAPILSGEVQLTGKNVVLVGSGMTGLETSEMLVEQGNHVTIIEMADKIAQGASGINILELKKLLDEAGATFITGRKLQRISAHTVTASDKTGRMETLNADAVILSLGSKKKDALVKTLENNNYKVFIMGDAEKVGRIGDAVSAAFRLARSMEI